MERCTIASLFSPSNWVPFPDILHPATAGVCFSTVLHFPVLIIASDCNTRYYPNYYVHDKATTCTYYLGGEIPQFIQSAEHFYTSADLCKLFANMMATAWCVAFWSLLSQC